jgi:glycosyltransferase involved in cell wall biosynthesis
MNADPNMPSSASYSIILPAFNESSRIGPSLEKALAFVRKQGWKAEIIVVDDGSSDDTAEVVRSFMRSAPELRLLENPGNRGKGYSVRNGMLNARGEILLFSDADFSSPVYEAVKLVNAIEQGADLAFGSRWLLAETQTRRQSLLRQFVGRAYNAILRVVLGLNYKDTQCGFKAFTRHAAELIFTRQQIERWGFDPELLYIARKFGLKMTEVAVEWAHDDRSKINPITDGVKMFWELLRIRIYSMAKRYERPTFQFISGKTSDAGTLLVGEHHPA